LIDFLEKKNVLVITIIHANMETGELDEKLRNVPEISSNVQTSTQL